MFVAVSQSVVIGIYQPDHGVYPRSGDKAKVHPTMTEGPRMALTPAVPCGPRRASYQGPGTRHSRAGVGASSNERAEKVICHSRESARTRAPPSGRSG